MVVFLIPAPTSEHNSLAVKISGYFKQRLSREYEVLYDTYTYISHEMLERLGHFKGGDSHEYMQIRLLDFGASASFIAVTMANLLKRGTAVSEVDPAHAKNSPAAGID